MKRPRGATVFWSFVWVAVAAMTSCASEPPLNLSPEAATGRDIANSNGCAACHGKNGQGNTGPSWQGLYLSRVKLDGGTTVLADADYLFRSITDPQAEVRRDWNVKMPTKDLSQDQVNSIVAYIKELQ